MVIKWKWPPRYCRKKKAKKPPCNVSDGVLMLVVLTNQKVPVEDLDVPLS